MSEYQLHPLCALFPRMNGAEFNALRDDIKANGLRQPIVLHEGMILDGGNRYAACLAAGVEPTFTQFDGGNLAVFVLSANLHRRHLSAGQQAAIVASAQDWSKANTHGGDRKSDQAARLPLDTVARRAAEAGASEKTQRMADKVAKADPDLAKQVAHGKVSLPKAVEKITGKRPGAKPKTAAEQERERIAEDANEGFDPLAELEAAQKENEQLAAELKATEADDLKAEALKWRRAYDAAVRAQSDAMDSAKRATDREAWTMRQLRRCGKAIGEDDPTKIAASVEAFARQYRKAA